MIKYPLVKVIVGAPVVLAIKGRAEISGPPTRNVVDRSDLALVCDVVDVEVAVAVDYVSLRRAGVVGS